MRDTLNKYLKPKGGRTFYIDPSYIIRSVPVTPNDHIYCTRLANNATVRPDSLQASSTVAVAVASRASVSPRAFAARLRSTRRCAATRACVSERSTT